jgi:hypothetical protein
VPGVGFSDAALGSPGTPRAGEPARSCCWRSSAADGVKHWVAVSRFNDSILSGADGQQMGPRFHGRGFIGQERQTVHDGDFGLPVKAHVRNLRNWTRLSLTLNTTFAVVFRPERNLLQNRKHQHLTQE